MEDDEESKNNIHMHRGIRKRKWGKWVSEIRKPGKKTRIWLGSYERADMAAAAYDVAAFHLKGERASLRLNFPDLIHVFPKPSSSRSEDVQMAAHEAAMRFKQPADAGPGPGPVRVGLSPTQIQAIHASPLDSPKMWTELLPSVREYTCPSYSFEDHQWDEIQHHHDSTWDF